MTLADLTDAEAAVVARFDAAPDAPESLVERVARAIHETEPCRAWPCDYSDEYREKAQAAIDAMKPTP
jgi:hypothetical protein